LEFVEMEEANDIDNELKIRRWVIHQMAIDEKFVIRAADDFTWADEMAHDQLVMRLACCAAGHYPSGIRHEPEPAANSPIVNTPR
jgi:hypothetical protein